jgi:hypothetical protein
MKKTIQYEHKASSKEYLVALAYFPGFSKLLNPETKAYKPLFDWLLDNQNFLADENNPLPSLKELATQLGTDSTKVSKHLKMIYEEIYDLNDKQPNLFKKEGQTLCFLSFNYLDQHAHFNLGLNVIPRKGEAFHFYFVKPKNGGDSFHVRDVVHSFENGKQEVRIYLTSEYPIEYMQLLREKAYLHGDISFMELLSEPNFSLRERLVTQFKNL